MLSSVTNEEGAVWFVVTTLHSKKVVLYISPQGDMHIPGDVIAFGSNLIPPLPTNDT